MIRFEKITVTLTGASGSAKSARPVAGVIKAIHIAYTDIADTGCDVTIATSGDGVPANTILVRSNSVTSGWFYPAVALCDAAAAAVTYDGTNEIYGYVPVCDNITVTIGTADAGSIVVTVLYED